MNRRPWYHFLMMEALAIFAGLIFTPMGPVLTFPLLVSSVWLQIYYVRKGPQEFMKQPMILLFLVYFLIYIVGFVVASVLSGINMEIAFYFMFLLVVPFIICLIGLALLLLILRSWISITS